MRNTKYDPKINGNLTEKSSVKLLNRIISFVLIFLIVFCIYSLFATQTYIGAEVEGLSMFPTINATKVNDYAYYSKRKTPKKGDIIVVDYHYAGDKIKAIKRLIATGGDTICYYNNAIYVNGVKLNEPYLDEDYELLKNNEDILKNGGYTSAEQWKNEGYIECKETFESFCEKLVNNTMEEENKVTEFFKNYQEKYSGSIVWDITINSYVLTLPENFVYFLGDNRGGSWDASELGPAPNEYVVGKVDFLTSINAPYIEKFTKQLIYWYR